MGEEGHLSPPYLADGCDLLAGKRFIAQGILKGVVAVDIGTCEVVESCGEEGLCLLADGFSIVSKHGHEIELEEDASFLEVLIIGVVHVHITLWVSQNGCVAARLDVLEDVAETIGGIEVGGLYQEVVALAAQRE